MAKKNRDTRHKKSNAVKQSSQKAGEAYAIKRKQFKKERERKAGNKEPSIDINTGLNDQDNETELNSTEDLVDAQKLAPEKEPVIDQD